MKRFPWVAVLVVLLGAALLCPEDALASRYGWQRDLASLINQLEYFLRHPPTWAKVAFCSVGAICLVYGFAIYRLVIMTPGILIGGVVGFAFGAMQWGDIAGILLGLLGGAVGGSIAWGLHQAMIWLIGAFLGGLLATGISFGIFHTEPHFLVILIAAIAGGSLLLFIAKSIIIVKTSALGALLVVIGAGKLQSPALLVLLFFVGLVVQFGVSRWMLKAGYTVGGAMLPRRQKETSGKDALPAGSGAPELPDDDALLAMVQVLEQSREKIEEMVARNCSLSEILGHFRDRHRIPDHLTLAYLEELATG